MLPALALHSPNRIRSSSSYGTCVCVSRRVQAKGKSSAAAASAKRATTTRGRGKAEKKVYSLPGQKFDPPEEREPLRIFYESLSKQIPSSEMAEFWYVLFPPHLRLDCVMYFSLAWPVATTAVCSAAILLWFYSSILLFFEQIYAYRRSRQDPGCYTLSSKFWTVGNSLEMKCKVQNQHPSTYKQAAKHLARSI